MLALGISLVSQPVVGGFDADAQAGINAVIAAGGTLTGAQQTALNAFVIEMKAQNIWSTLDLCYLYVGGVAAAHAVNWRSPGTYNITWYNSPTHNANGVQFSGTAYGRTGYNPSTASINNTTAGAFGYINSLGTTLTNRFIIGAAADSSTLEFSLLHDDLNKNNFKSGNYASRAAAGAAKTTNGFFSSQRPSNSTMLERYNDGVVNSIVTATSPAGGVNLELYIGLLNYNGAPTFYSTARQAMCGLYRTNLTGSQQTAFYNAALTLQTALGRA